MEDVGNVTERWAGSCKGDLLLLSSLMFVMHRSYQRRAMAKPMVKKKVMGKERRSKEKTNG
jgi:hypothetical protein